MTNLETALSIGTGTETTIEDLEQILIRGDIGLNDLDGLMLVEDSLAEMAEEYEYQNRIGQFGNNTKYFY